MSEHPPSPKFPDRSNRQRHVVHEEEEHGGEEGEGSWLVSYADLMTILCGFFVLMYTLSKPDPAKLEKMRKNAITYFGGTYQLPYQGLYDKLKKLTRDRGLEKFVNIEVDETGLTLTFQGTVFFDSGRAEILPRSIEILKQISDLVRAETSGFKIVVEGHTDDTPIVSAIYPSNWELSAARASQVIRLFEGEGYNRRLLTAIGYADTQPVVPNREADGTPSAAGQSQNRRVIIRILKETERKVAGSPAKVASTPDAPTPQRSNR